MNREKWAWIRPFFSLYNPKRWQGIGSLLSCRKQGHGFKTKMKNTPTQLKGNAYGRQGRLSDVNQWGPAYSDGVGPKLPSNANPLNARIDRMNLSGLFGTLKTKQTGFTPFKPLEQSKTVSFYQNPGTSYRPMGLSGCQNVCRFGRFWNIETTGPRFGSQSGAWGVPQSRSSGRNRYKNGFGRAVSLGSPRVRRRNPRCSSGTKPRPPGKDRL